MHGRSGPYRWTSTSSPRVIGVIVNRRSSAAALPEKSRQIHVSFFHRLTAYYSATIAPVGQTDSQEPQSTQASVTTYLVSPSSIAPVGQVPAQEPHFTHSSVITCMSFTSKNYSPESILSSPTSLLHERKKMSISTLTVQFLTYALFKVPRGTKKNIAFRTVEIQKKNRRGEPVLFSVSITGG